MLISCFVFCILTAGCHGRAKGRRKGGCSACNAVRIMPCALEVVRYGTQLILQRHIRAWCPHSACLSFGNSRRPDIMGIGQEDTSTYFFEHQYSFRFRCRKEERRRRLATGRESSGKVDGPVGAVGVTAERPNRTSNDRGSPYDCRNINGGSAADGIKTG